MISVEQALRRVLAGFAPLAAETVGLDVALGRVLAAEVAARVTQPPHAVSAMDGYAVRAADTAAVPTVLRQIGAVPAGGAFAGTLGPGETVRIFTGAAVPDGADAIVIQEDTRTDGAAVTVRESVSRGTYVRPAGLDFSAGDVGINAGRRLGARDIALAAAMNVPWLRVTRKPRVAILATGDEIVMPGEPRTANQIVSSNSLALAAMVTAFGGVPVNLGIARDDRGSIRSMAAGARGADLLVTTGGASVGDHDLVRSVLGEAGLAVDFWRIAMRPGKPMIFGRIGETPLLGLPGNPVSTMVCGLLFMRPAINAMLGIPGDAVTGDTAAARLATDIAANDRRQDYLRATLARDEHGNLVATPFSRQDSSMISRLAAADCLIVRAPHAAGAAAGDFVPIIAFAHDPSGF